MRGRALFHGAALSAALVALVHYGFDPRLCAHLVAAAVAAASVVGEVTLVRVAVGVLGAREINGREALL